VRFKQLPLVGDLKQHLALPKILGFCGKTLGFSGALVAFVGCHKPIAHPQMKKVSTGGGRLTIHDPKLLAAQGDFDPLYLHGHLQTAR
jgi:hypothetical protein